MKAAVYTRYGPPEVIHIEEVPNPVPGDNDVLVCVHATTVSAADWRLRKADPYITRFMTTFTIMHELGFQKSSVSIQGIRIEYYQKLGGNIPLLILHGWCHSKERWLPFSSELNDRFSIVIPDLPGFGDSDKHQLS